MAKQLKGILFDLDDTLIDWRGVTLGWRGIETPHLANVHAYVNQNLQRFDVAVDQLADLYMARTRSAWMQARNTRRAPNMPKLLLAALVELGVAADKLIPQDIIAAYDWDAVPGTAVFPDVPPMLDALTAAGIKIGIVTNASQPMRMRDIELAAHRLLDYFPDCRLSAADAGWLKPHQRIFKLALKRLGAAPDETLFVGDNLIADISGAQSSGMRAILRLKPGINSNHRGLTVPDGSIYSFDELPSILDQWHPGWRNYGG